MSTTVCADDLSSPAALADPYPLYARLRRRDPVHRDERLDAWLLTRYDDVVRALGDARLFSSDRTDPFLDHLDADDRQSFAPFARIRRRILTFTDPPAHDVGRDLATNALSARLVAAMEPYVHRVVNEVLDRVVAECVMDVVEELGRRLPVTVNARAVGVPDADCERVKRWTSAFAAGLSGAGASVPAATLARAQDALGALRDYVASLATRRRTRPRNDLVSRLVARADLTGADPEDVYATCIALLFAGLETSANVVGNGVLALLRHPGEIERLRRADGAAARVAVDELLRYDSPLQMLGRVVTADVSMRGRQLRAGDKVLLVVGAANRDPAEFRSPDRLDLARRPNRHLAFAHGIHYCPGAALARREAEIAFTTLVRRVELVGLETDAVTWHANLSFRGPASLPVRVRPRAA